MKSSRCMAKVIGTIVSVVGATSMTLLKGPKLLNMDFAGAGPVFLSGSDNWTLGCLLLFASCWCWSFWLVLQVLPPPSLPKKKKHFYRWLVRVRPFSTVKYQVYALFKLNLFSTIQICMLTCYYNLSPQYFKIMPILNCGLYILQWIK